jgi:hypothetical protein
MAKATIYSFVMKHSGTRLDPLFRYNRLIPEPEYFSFQYRIYRLRDSVLSGTFRQTKLYEGGRGYTQYVYSTYTADVGEQ